MDALNRPEYGFPHPEEGKNIVIYIYIAFFSNSNSILLFPYFRILLCCRLWIHKYERILTLYKGKRYHLRDYRGPGRAPRGPQELFNYRHSSLRNVIEQ